MNEVYDDLIFKLNGGWFGFFSRIILFFVRWFCIFAIGALTFKYLAS